MVYYVWKNIFLKCKKDLGKLPYKVFESNKVATNRNYGCYLDYLNEKRLERKQIINLWLDKKDQIEFRTRRSFSYLDPSFLE